MAMFWNLVTYEYKKIFKKKSVIITLVIALLLTIFNILGVVIGYHYENGKQDIKKYDFMVQDREYARALKGRKIDTELFMECIDAYNYVPSNTKGAYSATQEYKIYARPYSGIRQIIYNINHANLEGIQKLTSDQMDKFYETRLNIIKKNLKTKLLNDNSRQKILSLEQDLSKPFVFDYTYGYQRFFVNMYVEGIILCLVIAICISPIFSEEYCNKTDRIILAGKHGKSKFINAKIFTGVSFSLIITVGIIALTYLMCMIIYGFDGSGAPIQLQALFSSYPFTVGQVAGLLTVSSLSACMFVAALTIFLSSKAKSQFGPVIIISSLTILTIMIRYKDVNIFIEGIKKLLPLNMMDYWSLISPVFYEVFSWSIQPYIVRPVFATLVSIILLILAHYSFKNHQIS